MDSDNSFIALPDDLLYSPTVDDVWAVRSHFLCFFPNELIDAILDMAKYWPCIRATRNLEIQISAKQTPAGYCPQVDTCYLTTAPIPNAVKRIQEVVFTIESRGLTPQCSKQRCNSACSWTWFEVAIIRCSSDDSPWWLQKVIEERPVDLCADGYERSKAERVAARAVEVSVSETHPHRSFCPKRWHVMANKLDQKEWETREVVWRKDCAAADLHPRPRVLQSIAGRYDGAAEFVKGLRGGDRVALMARALFPGWKNCVRNASVHIYYSS